MNKLSVAAPAQPQQKVITGAKNYINLYTTGDLIGNFYSTLEEASNGRNKATLPGVVLSITRDTNGDFTCKVEKEYP